MSEIRILHYIPDFNFGGIESLISNLYSNIDHKKVKFDFLIETNKINEMLEDLKLQGCRVFVIPKLAISNIPLYLTKIDLLFKNNKFDAVHSHSYLKGYFILKEAKKYNIETRIFHSHTSKETFFKYYLPSFILRKMQVLYATNLLACSRKAANFAFGKIKLWQRKVTFFKNSIEIEEFAFNIDLRLKIRNKYNINDKFVIGHVGRLCKPKNQFFLIDIFKEVIRLYPNSKLMIVGDGNLENEIKNYVKQIGLQEDVVFLGKCSNVNELMQGMDAFVLPSLFEGFPITCIEAQCSGLQCFLSNAITKEAEITDLVHYISIKKSASFWANQIIEYKDIYQRYDRSDHIRKSGYDIKTQAILLQNFYLNKCRSI